MAIFNLFSKRQKKLRGEVPELFIYDNFPKNFKIQIMHVWDDAIGIDNYHDSMEQKAYEEIHNILCREYGVFNLVSYDMYPKDNVRNFFLNENNSEKILDVIELVFKYINTYVRTNSYIFENQKINSDEAILDLNERFKEHGIGFSFENNEIIRIDSTYIHCEITKPTISLLWKKSFKGSNDEYMKAHEHYKNGRNKECLNDCLKAFESCLKTICKIKRWDYNETDTAKKLIRICFENELVPSYTQNQFTSLQNLIESGIPTIRNKQGGHGQGESITVVDDTLTRYALNLTGSNIIFLVEQSGI